MHHSSHGLEMICPDFLAGANLGMKTLEFS